MIIIRILFFLLLIGFIIFLIGAFFLAFVTRNFTKRFKQQKENRQQSVNGNVVIDRRDPQQANKKIIPKDEGEYIDFEEE
jgi:membrane protein implicated in regulation of membrane protease activity